MKTNATPEVVYGILIDKITERNFKENSKE